jgi:hypothetical protein
VALSLKIGPILPHSRSPACARSWIKIGAKVVSDTFQMAEIAVSRQMFAEILSLIARLRAPPAPA